MGTNKIALPRGIRNNNPGNIRHSISLWQGRAKKQPDASFVSFTTSEYGIRALARILMNYQSRHKLQTIEQMINRWAPPNENDTDAYVAAVTRSAGTTKNANINLRANPALFHRFVAAIINHENGNPRRYGRTEWYDTQTLNRGISMAIGPQPQHGMRTVHIVIALLLNTTETLDSQRC